MAENQEIDWHVDDDVDDTDGKGAPPISSQGQGNGAQQPQEHADGHIPGRCDVGGRCHCVKTRDRYREDDPQVAKAKVLLSSGRLPPPRVFRFHPASAPFICPVPTRLLLTVG